MKYIDINQWKKIGICAAIIFLVLARSLCAESLVAGVSSWLPWQDGQREEPRGILVDIFTNAAQGAGFEWEVISMPHKRRNEVEWGKSVNVELGVIPEWRKQYAQVSVYTIPFVATRDIILARKGDMDKARSVRNFYGKRLGATLGYFYPDGFSNAFEAGLIMRDDTPEGPNLVQKLISGRVDCVILDKHEARYWIAQLGLNPGDFEIVYTFSLISNLRMRLHKDQEHAVPALNAALRKMLETDVIQEIIESYINYDLK